MNLAARLFYRGSMFGDIAQTSVVGIFVVVLTIIAQGIAARIWVDDPDSLSIYLLMRKINLAIVPLVILGMSMALSRHMPMYASQGRAGRRRLALVTMSVVLVSAIIVSALLVLFKEVLANLLFGDPKYQYLIRGLIAYVCGTVCFTQVSAYFQGRMWMVAANVMQFTAIGIVQVVVLLAIPKAGVAKIIELIGYGILAISLVFLAVAIGDLLLGKDDDVTERTPTVLESLKTMLKYGIPRVPSFLAMSGLWLLSPLLVVQFGDLGTSRYFVTGMTLLAFVDIPFKPMTIVFLPRFAEMKAQGRFDDMSRLISMLSTMLIQIGLLGTAQLAIFIPIVLRAWMKFTDPQAYLLATIIVLAVPAYLVFDILRNPIDSYTVTPINTFTISGSLGLLILLAWLLTKVMPAATAVAWATTSAFIVLGLITYIIARKLMIRPGKIKSNPGYLSAFIAIALLAAAGYGIKVAIIGLGDLPVLAFTAVWAMAVTAIFYFVQLKAGVLWAVELRERIVNRNR